MIYLDTSALLKLYVRETNSDVVQAILTGQDEPLPVWELQQAEFMNALQLKVYWGEIDGAEADRLQGLFEQRLRKRQYYVPEIDRPDLMLTFRKLISKTRVIGCRTMDVLHVACALQLGPDCFVSFDDRQRQLASESGLHVRP